MIMWHTDGHSQLFGIWVGSLIEFPFHNYFGFLAQNVLSMPTSHFLFGCGLRWAWSGFRINTVFWWVPYWSFLHTIVFVLLAQKSIFFTVLRMPTSHFHFGCGLRWAGSGFRIYSWRKKKLKLKMCSRRYSIQVIQLHNCLVYSWSQYCLELFSSWNLGLIYDEGVVHWPHPLDDSGLLKCVISTFLAWDMSLKLLKSTTKWMVCSRFWPLCRQESRKS